MQKIKVYHFHNGGGGGVLSVIRNILKYSANADIENHVIHTINKDINPAFTIDKIEGAVSENIFYYSPKWNFYYTCKQLAKLLPNKRSIIVAHDWLELGMASSLGLQNPVIQFLHGNYEYYYTLSKKHEKVIDQFIAVSPVIYNKLCLSLPGRKTAIEYCRFPVPPVWRCSKDDKILKIIYCVKYLTEPRKQFNLLPLINAQLIAKEIPVKWTIVGEGIKIDEINERMQQEKSVTLFASLTNERVLELLPEHDLFILPSLEEGFPVSVVEAMKGGVVPLITNWDGATAELVISGETGYYFKVGDVNGYANRIALLNGDRKLLQSLSLKGAQKANQLFDPYLNTKNIEAVIIKTYEATMQPKIPRRIYGSRLDQSWLPNIITTLIRGF